MVDESTEYDVVYVSEGVEYKLEDFTCYNCANSDSCEYAWSLYNIGGDCLAWT